uniref:LRRNT domain-containing protein n=1 Tax=Rhabditophanes sp. KR3021 TaxID=114890 RepID=A0AC35U9F2_9BILA
MKVCILLLAIIALAFGYNFDCLNDGCTCDTDSEMASCHGLGLTELQLPKGRLRAIQSLRITGNNFRTIPSEEVLLEKLPDLGVVDVEQNADFDCTNLHKYHTIAVFSSCGNSKSAGETKTTFDHGNSPAPPTADCDFGCQAQRYTVSVAKYAKHIWRLLLNKIDDLEQTDTVKELKNFYQDFKRKLSDQFS